MGDAIIEKDVVLLIMILNGQLKNIMHDMMQTHDVILLFYAEDF